MAKVKKSFAETLRQDSSGGATDVLLFSPPEQFEKQVFTQIIAYNEDNAITSIEIKAGSIDNEIEVRYVANPQAGERIKHVDPVILVKYGENLIVVFTGATALDNLRVVLRGWREYDVRS